MEGVKAEIVDINRNQPRPRFFGITCFVSPDILTHSGHLDSRCFLLFRVCADATFDA